MYVIQPRKMLLGWRRRNLLLLPLVLRKGDVVVQPSLLYYLLQLLVQSCLLERTLWRKSDGPLKLEEYKIV